MKSSPQPANTSTANPAGGKEVHISGQLLGMGRADVVIVVCSDTLASALSNLKKKLISVGQTPRSLGRSPSLKASGMKNAVNTPLLAAGFFIGKI